MVSGLDGQPGFTKKRVQAIPYQPDVDIIQRGLPPRIDNAGCPLFATHEQKRVEKARMSIFWILFILIQRRLVKFITLRIQFESSV